MELNIKGKRCLITGGSKGIGLAIKKALEKEGVEVISWSRSEGVNLDLFYPRDKGMQIQEIDILINNFGGGGTWKPFDFDKVIHRNYGITHDLTMEFISHKRKWGRVI